MKGDSTKRREIEQCCVLWENDLRVFLRSVMRDVHGAEDAYQRTVVRAMEAAESLRTESVRGWLFRIALNEARQIQREAARNAARLPVISQMARAAARQELVESGLITEETIAAVAAAIRRLPDDQQTVVHRRLVEGHSFAEIARQMNRPIGTVLTWMHRGLGRLRDDPGLRKVFESDGRRSGIDDRRQNDATQCHESP